MRGLILLILLSSVVYADSIFLSDFLYEGGTAVYEASDGIYVVSLVSVSDGPKEKALFRLNGELSKGIKFKDSFVFEDGSEIVVDEILVTESGEGQDSVSYHFYGTGKEVVKVKNISSYVIGTAQCNFDGECINETTEYCCYDCGCSDGSCVNNQCVIEEVEIVQEEPIVTEETPSEVIQEPLIEENTEEKEKKGAFWIVGLIILIVAGIILKKFRRKKPF